MKRIIGLALLALLVASRADTASLVLSGVVEKSMAADFRLDMATKSLKVRNFGNESFRVIVEDPQMPEQLRQYLSGLVPAQTQGDFAFQIQRGTDAKSTLSVSIQAP